MGIYDKRDFDPPPHHPPPLDFGVFRHLTSMGGWPQRIRGSHCSRSARAQGRNAMVAFSNQCEPFSIVTPTRAKL